MTASTPEFGGECAFATSLGKHTGGSAKYALTRDGKTYHFKNPVARMLFRLIPGSAERAHARSGRS